MPWRRAGWGFLTSDRRRDVRKPCSAQPCSAQTRRRTAARASAKVGRGSRYQAAGQTAERARWRFPREVRQVPVEFRAGPSGPPDAPGRPPWASGGRGGAAACRRAGRPAAAGASAQAPRARSGAAGSGAPGRSGSRRRPSYVAVTRSGTGIGQAGESPLAHRSTEAEAEHGASPAVSSRPERSPGPRSPHPAKTGHGQGFHPSSRWRRGVDPARVGAAHQSLHHFVAKAAWDDAALLRAVRDYALPAIEERGPIRARLVDDAGLPEKGRLSAGVARQYCGRLGKRDDCQVAVTLSVANEAASLPVTYGSTCPRPGPATRNGGRRRACRRRWRSRPSRRSRSTRSGGRWRTGCRRGWW